MRTVKVDGFSWLLWTLAAAWFTLGVLSTETPVFQHQVWIVFSGVVVGSTLAFERARTIKALNTHVMVVGAYAVLRVSSLLTVGRQAAVAVWLIILIYTLILDHLVRRQVEGGR